MDLEPLQAYTWALLLGLFVPLSWILALLLGPGVIVFAVAGLAIVPLAWFLGLATEELGKHAGPGVGGLLNATFGNATELIIAIFALSRGLTEVVKASLTGSGVGDLLLVLGLSLVGSLEIARLRLGLTELFVGVIIVAIVGNAAEHGSAILMAWRNKMELSVAVATTSTTQVALFVAPILVFVSLLTAKVMTLDFEIFELASLALATAVVAAVVSHGPSNRYRGALLVMGYPAVAVAVLFHPPLA